MITGGKGGDLNPDGVRLPSPRFAGRFVTCKPWRRSSALPEKIHCVDFFTKRVPHRNQNAPPSAVTIENSTTPVRQDASERVRPGTDIGAMPRNSGPNLEQFCTPGRDPVPAALDAARERWLATGDARAVRLLLLDAMEATEK